MTKKTTFIFCVVLCVFAIGRLAGCKRPPVKSSAMEQDCRFILPPSRIIALAKYQDNRPVRLLPFIGSPTLYAIEVGHRYMRFYRDGYQIQFGAVPYEIVTPWDANDVFGIRYKQEGRSLRLEHPRGSR